MSMSPRAALTRATDIAYHDHAVPQSTGQLKDWKRYLEAQPHVVCMAKLAQALERMHEARAQRDDNGLFVSWLAASIAAEKIEQKFTGFNLPEREASSTLERVLQKIVDFKRMVASPELDAWKDVQDDYWTIADDDFTNFMARRLALGAVRYEPGINP